MARRKKRYDYWGYFPRSTPIPVEGGIKARSRRGEFGEHWWARRWTAVLESYGWDNRLRRGRTYARKGQVLNIEIHPGRVSAQVQGSRRTPYEVRIQVTKLTDAQWSRVVDQMAGQAIFAARLLAGEMPPDIEEAFTAAGVSLFPHHHEIGMSCSCPDWAVPCKHIAAVYYLLAEEFDRDPFLLFLLRGATREYVMDALRSRRVAAVEAEPGEQPPEVESGEPLEADPLRFWEPQEPLTDFRVAVAPPPVETALLKRLGPPDFSRRPEAFVGVLTLAYATVTERALALAFDEEDVADMANEGLERALED